MKHYVLDEHSSYCTCDKQIHDFFGHEYKFCKRDYCKRETSVFFLNYEFHLLTINSCLKEHEFVMDVLQELYNKKVKVKETDSCYFGLRKMSDEITKIRKNGFIFKDYLDEVNYVYGANKRYCLITRQPYIEKLFSNITDDYKKTIEYISEHDYLKNIRNDVDYLYEANSIYEDLSDIKIYTTINDLIINLNKKTK